MSIPDVLLNTIIWVYVLVCVSLFLPAVRTVTGLGAGLGVGYSYKFIRIVHLIKYVRFRKKSYEFVRVRSYDFVRISHLLKYLWIAVRSGWYFTTGNILPVINFLEGS